MMLEIKIGKLIWPVHFIVPDILNIPKRTVEREIKNLRESRRITRKGGRRYGYWEVI